jgi:hypothetical protein
VSELENFEIMQDYAVFKPVGPVVLEQAIQLVKSAIIKARESRIHKLLIDITGLTGFDPPSVTARYSLIHEWAQAAGGIVRVAVVAPKEMIDLEKFGGTVAGNVGLHADVFISEVEALTWLAATYDKIKNIEQPDFNKEAGQVKGQSLSDIIIKDREDRF